MIEDRNSRLAGSPLGLMEFLERCTLELANAEHYLAVSVYYVEQAEHALDDAQSGRGTNLAGHWFRRAKQPRSSLAASYHQAIEAATANLDLATAHALDVHQQGAVLAKASDSTVQLRALLHDDVAQLLRAVEEARSALRSAVEQLDFTPGRHSTGALTRLSTASTHLNRARERAELSNTHVDQFLAAGQLPPPRHSYQGDQAASEQGCCPSTSSQISA